MVDKIIQVDTNRLKLLFSAFEKSDNMRGLLSICNALEYNLDQQKFFTLSEQILTTKKRVDNVNETLLQIKNLLISSGCTLD